MSMLDLYEDAELAEFIMFGFIGKLMIPNIDEEIIQFQNIEFESFKEWEDLAFMGILKYMSYGGIWGDSDSTSHKLELLKFDDIAYTGRLIETCKIFYPKINFFEKNELIDLIVKTDYLYPVYYNLTRSKTKYLWKSIYDAITYNYIQNKFIKLGKSLHNDYDIIYKEIDDLYDKVEPTYTFNKKKITDLSKYDNSDIKVDFNWQDFSNIIYKLQE
jgi:hypothetical protein